MELSTENREVLAHVVVDPDAWLDHVVTTFGEEKAKEMLLAKVERWKPEYIADKERLGSEYKNRAARDEEEQAK